LDILLIGVQADGCLQNFERLGLLSGPDVALAQGVQQPRVAVVDLVPFEEADDGAAIVPQACLGLAFDEEIFELELLRVFEAFGEGERLLSSPGLH